MVAERRAMWADLVGKAQLVDPPAESRVQVRELLDGDELSEAAATEAASALALMDVEVA